MSYHGEIKKSKKGQTKLGLFAIVILSVVFTVLGASTSSLYFIVAYYLVVHIFFGPLDWYLIYVLYKKLRR